MSGNAQLIPNPIPTHLDFTGALCKLLHQPIHTQNSVENV